MKQDKYWHIDSMDYLLFALSILGILLVILSHRVKNDVENIITTTDTITVTDTIENWQHDTMYLSRLDTIKLPVVDTINDTIIKLDSILVQIPISTYQYDTVISDTNYTTHFSASLTGYKLSFDTLCLSTEIIENKPITITKKWYNHIAPAIGVGYGVNGFGLFVGIGYTL